MNDLNISANKDVFNQGLVDATLIENNALNLIQSDGVFTDSLSKESMELTPLEGSLTNFDVGSVFMASAFSSASDSDRYAVFAEGKLTNKGQSDFDGDPLNPQDDAYIYAGDGFNFKGNSTFPILRNDLGEPILDSDRKQQLVEGAVVVGDNYSKANAKALNKNLSGLNPPEVVPATELSIPAYTDTVNDELTRRIVPDSEPIIFNVKQNQIKNVTDWYNLFPMGGTRENPTYIRVVSGKLNIPNSVDLSHYNIIVEKGDIIFKGNNNILDDVLLQAESGKIAAKKLVANDVSLLASDRIDINNDSQFTGKNLIANGKGKIEFKNNVATPSEADSLRVISANDVKLESPSLIRGQLLSRDDLNIKGQSTFYGSLGAKDDINFNGGVKVYATANEPEPPALSIDSMVVSKGEDASADFIVTLDQPAAVPITVDYALTYSIENTPGAATVESTITLTPGEISQTIASIALVEDGIGEVDKNYTVELSNPVNATIVNGQEIATITDNESTP